MAAMRTRRCPLLRPVLCTLVLCCGPAWAEAPPDGGSPRPPAAAVPPAANSQPAADPSATGHVPPRIKAVYVNRMENKSLQFGLGDTLIVQLELGGFHALNAAANPREGDKHEVGLILDGLYIKGVPPLLDADNPDSLLFTLSLNEENQRAWSALLSARLRRLHRSDPVTLTVGLDNPSLLQAQGARKVNLVILPGIKALFLIVAILLLLSVFFYLARTTALIRDSGPMRADKQLSTYSLGRTQMALWFLSVVIAFLFIWAMTGAAAEVTTSILTLMGIGAGTALGAALIDDGKRASRVALSEVPMETPASKGLRADLLMDETGYSLHRFQITVWTLVLWVLFWGSVLQELAMPDFNTTLLALMGISAGTYIGFKLPEK